MLYKHFVRSWVFVIVAIVVLTGCVANQTYSNLSEAMSKVPLPPEVTEFSTDGDESATNFYIRAECPTLTTDGIFAFYEEYFNENGWENDYTEDEKAEGILSYSKGRASIR